MSDTEAPTLAPEPTTTPEPAAPPPAAAPPPSDAPAPAAEPADKPPITAEAAEAIRLKVDTARINRLTREKNDARRDAEVAQRERDFYKALADGKPGGEAPPASLPQQPTVTDAEIERRAELLNAQRNSETRRQTLVGAGLKEYTPDVWQAKTEVLQQLGATENPAFMRAVVAVHDGHKVVAALADDPDRVTSLLRMDPVEMAAEMGRMSAELSAPRPTKPVSAAPAPIAAPAGRTQPTPDIYDTSSMSMKEYAAHRAKTAPAHLGGQRKAR